MDGVAPADKSSHAAFAKSANAEVWALLDKGERTPEEDERMIHAAHASLYHWLYAGTLVNAQRGEWLLAHVYTVLGHDQLAMHHALRCVDLTLAHPGDMADFDRAYAEESLGRAYALMGDLDQARQHRREAASAGEKIRDEGDRKTFVQDFARGPWFGLGDDGGPGAD
jgi:hypothetical protein